jgi:N-acetyl-anhydromuramyl-L-alanine amidase AmpD
VITFKKKNERDLLLERLEYIRGRKALLEKIITEEKPQEILKNNEKNTEIATELVEEENENTILQEFNKLNEESTKEVIFALNKLAKEKREDFLDKESKTPEELTKILADTLDKVHSGKVGPLWMKIANKFWNQKNKWLRGSIRLLTLSAGVSASVALSYHTPQEYWQLWKNWKERHMDKEGKDDPKIVGISEGYDVNKIGDSTNVERSTYDFIGEHKIDYKFGYYKTSVFDLSDRTPPRFKLINDRENYSDIDSAAGITTNLFKKFYSYGEFSPALKGHTGLGAEKIGDIPVVGYNTKTQQIKAGHYKEFNDDWMVSETYEIPLNFKLNPDSTLNLVYHEQALRMVPVSINEKGKEIPFPIGVSVDKNLKATKPSDCTHFGTLEGGKIIMVCGDKQLQVNGSFSDMYHVYQRLQNEYRGVPIQAFLLDNGSYNLPIWDNDQKITTEEIKKHLLRNTDGGTALVLINDERISPYEYKNKYKEYQNYTPNFTLDSITHKPAINEKQVIVIHHTGEYEEADSIIRQFKNPESNTSSHVVIMKDGTRYLFNTDNSVLAHAGKSDFNNRNAVNYFSLGVEMEGDTKNHTQFTIAQLESLLEYLRPRIEKYGIKFENITTHKIIRDNYIKKHPDSTQVKKKEDLDDEVWKQIQELIKKKLYNKVSSDSITGKGKTLLKTISYQDAYRSYKDKELALEQVRTFFKEQGIKDENLEEVYNVMNNRSYESSQI